MSRPSGWRNNASRNRFSYDDHMEEAEELRHEQEVTEAEEHIVRPTSRRNQSTPSLSSSLPTHSRPYHILRTPSESLASSSTGGRVKKRKSSNFAISIPPLHTSSSEIFLDASAPTLTRRTTYSSLPPSPGIDNVIDFDIVPRLTLNIPDVTKALRKLQSRESLRGQESEDEFWPAKSRRPTLVGQDQRPDLRQEPHIPPAPRSDLSSSSEAREGIPNGPDPDQTPSLWDLLKDEQGLENWDGWVVDGKWERIANFLAVPLAVEKITLFGSLLCLDGFLYNFTVLPVRSGFAVYRIARNLFTKRQISPIPPNHLQSLLRMMLLFIPTVVLLLATDASKMYHTVRGQDTIKLYVIFNALEIGDRLCCAFGQDVLDTLFARETLAPTTRKLGRGRRRQQARPVFFFMLSLGYVLVHTLIFFYMLVSLNVAINSYDYTLLSLLISNQFVEIKGSVFKKFEKENLFQIMCADIVERFQLALMLCVIALRNMIEMAGSDLAFLPKSFIRGRSLVDSIFSPLVFVILSEMLVDWLKHAFITKFNHVRASVYARFMDVLAKDVLAAGSITSGNRQSRRSHPMLLDQSPLVARRLGFASIPLACLVIRIGAQAIGMLASTSHRNDEPMASSSGWWWFAFKWTAGLGVGISAWGCLVGLKILLGLSLLSFSALRQSDMDAREAEDAVNDFGRSAVGQSKEETSYNKQTSRYLAESKDDLQEHPFPQVRSNAPPVTSEIHAGPPGRSTLGEAKVPIGGDEKGGKKGKKWRLEEVERWSMVKRIW